LFDLAEQVAAKEIGQDANAFIQRETIDRLAHKTNNMQDNHSVSGKSDMQTNLFETCLALDAFVEPSTGPSTDSKLLNYLQQSFASSQITTPVAYEEVNYHTIK